MDLRRIGVSIAAMQSRPSHLCCGECGSRLAYDQRYCVECGARRGALPATTAEWIGIQTPATSGASATSEAPTSATVPETRRAPSLPSPRIMAVAVMALLAFGVLIGSSISPVQKSSARGPLVVAVAHTAQAPNSVPATAETPTQPPAAESEETPAAAESSSSPTPSETKPKAKPKPKRTQPSKTKGAEPEGALGGQTLPPIKHVFLVVLSDQGFNQAFGPASPAQYLAKTLTGQGELLDDYYAVAGGELANEIALISGQGPTPQIAEDCPLYTAITPGTVGAAGQVLGSGCVYPSQTSTLAGQLTAGGLTWKAYVEGIGETPTELATCPHPVLGGADGNHTPTAEDPYVTWRDPFAYFEGVTGSASCASSIVGAAQLASDLKTAKETPALSYIVPDRCHDGSEEPCAPGAPAGLADTESFLSTVVPEIESSPAYKTGGLIAITFDQAPQSGPNADMSGCCMTSAFPNLPSAPAAGSPTTTTSTTPSGTTGTSTSGTPATPATPPGGGRVGLLLISKYTEPGSINVTGEYNDFSLLASIEDLFGLSHLGYAGEADLLTFNKSVYNAKG
jgi:phosphatidylinositol-3-phosphatase